MEHLFSQTEQYSDIDPTMMEKALRLPYWLLSCYHRPPLRQQPQHCASVCGCRTVVKPMLKTGAWKHSLSKLLFKQALIHYKFQNIALL